MREQILIDLLIYTVGSMIRKKTTSHNGMPHQISVTKKNTLIQGFLIKSTGQLQIKICWQNAGLYLKKKKLKIFNATVISCSTKKKPWDEHFNLITYSTVTVVTCYEDKSTMYTTTQKLVHPFTVKVSLPKLLWHYLFNTTS